MKLEELNRIYSDKVAEMLNAGWVIQPRITTNCYAALVFRRDGDYRVVYMNMHACDKNFQYGKTVSIGIGTPTGIIGSIVYIEECLDMIEHTYLQVSNDWFVAPQDFHAVIDKRIQRHNRKRRVGMFREFLGGKHEIPSPEACRTAYKLVRKVKGYGNTPINGILRVWYESGTEGNWHCKPTLCIQVAGKPVEARIPMPCAR